MRRHRRLVIWLDWQKGQGHAARSLRVEGRAVAKPAVEFMRLGANERIINHLVASPTASSGSSPPSLSSA